MGRGEFLAVLRDTPVTISVGCAAEDDEPAELIRQASGALRQAKHGGKNRVAAAPPRPGQD